MAGAKLSMFCKTILIVVVVATMHTAYAQSWTNKYHGPANTNDSANVIALDDTGNVYVGGRSGGADGYTDIAIVAYSSAGMPLWTNRHHGPELGDEGAVGIAADHSGHVFVAGGTTDIFTSTNSDFVVLAYTSAGMPLWTNRYVGAGHGGDAAGGIAVDKNGHVLVSGTSTGASGDREITTLAYSASGTPLWTNTFSGPGNTNVFGLSLRLDDTGNAYVCGVTATKTYVVNFLIIAYSNSGIPLWTNDFGFQPAGQVLPGGMAVTGDGNVYVTALVFQQGFSPYVLANDATIAYSQDGTALWTNVFSGNGSTNENNAANSFSVAVGKSGNVFIAGIHEGNLGGYSNQQLVTIAYTSNGLPLWTNLLPFGVYLGVNVMTLDGNDNVYVTSEAQVGDGSECCSTVAYSSGGTLFWTNGFTGPPDYNSGLAITADSRGNVYVAGDPAGFDGITSFVTVKYPAPPLVLVGTNTNFGFANGQFGFDVTGLAGSTVVIQSSVDWNQWTPVQTNLLTDGRFHFIDPSTGSATNRFFRGVLLP